MAKSSKQSFTLPEARVATSVQSTLQNEYCSELKLWTQTPIVRELLEGVIVSNALLSRARYVKRESRERINHLTGVTRGRLISARPEEPPGVAPAWWCLQRIFLASLNIHNFTAWHSAGSTALLQGDGVDTARRQVLVVASRGPITNTIVERLGRHEWTCKIVHLLTEAREELQRSKYEIVLAAEYLPDGRGYELTADVAQRSSSLLVGVMLSDGYLWLPTVERGARILGMGAVNPDLLEETMEDMLPPEVFAAAAKGPSKLPVSAGRRLGRHALVEAQRFSSREITRKQTN